MSGGHVEMRQPLLDQEDLCESAGYPPTVISPQVQQYGAPVIQYSNASYPAFHVVTVQPTVVTTTQLFNPLPDYLGYSIFTMLCCCLPLGVAALVYSITTRDANKFAHQQIAEKNSRMARILNHVNVGIGLSFYLFFVICLICVWILVY